MLDSGAPPKSTAPVRPPPLKKMTAPVDEEKKVAPAKPAAAAKGGAPTTAGGPKGPKIEDEDVGSGLSKEEADSKVAEHFPQFYPCFEETKKWNEKVEGYKGIAEAIVPM